jgi:hypothetical protein
MTTIPLSAPVMQLVYGPCQDAITRAIHDAAPLKFHKRHGIGDDCPVCPSALSEEIEAKLDEILPEGAVLAPWQRKLALEVLEAKSEEMDAVVDQATPSPALQEYLDRHELVPDAVSLPPAYSKMTAKDLRPLASAAGMKGARVAKKAEMVEFLEAQ